MFPGVQVAIKGWDCFYFQAICALVNLVTPFGIYVTGLAFSAGP